MKVSTEVTYEVWQEGMIVASSSDISDATHYLIVYGQDGDAQLLKATTERTFLTEVRITR